MSELSLSNVIRVTVQGVQRSKGVKNINEVALFTPEQPNSIEPYIVCIDPSAVVKAYGTDSLTAKMAQNVFAQNANVNTGKGYLVVIPMKATSATVATASSAAIEDISKFKSVKDGAIKVVVDGTTYTIGSLDFSNVASLEDIVKILQAQMPLAKVSVKENIVTFASKKLGEQSSITVSQGSGGTDITGATYLNMTGGKKVTGVSAKGETLVQAIERTKGLVRYTGIMTAEYIDDKSLTPINEYIAANDFIFVNTWYSTADIKGECASIKQKEQNKTRCLVYTRGLEEAKLAMAAYVGRAFSVDFDATDTSQTMNLKTLVNVLPDDGISQTDYMNAKESGVDLYVSYEGDNGVASNGANGYFDTVYENLALKFYAQIALYNALKTTGTKMPQTESGMAGLRDALAQVFIKFVRNGVIAAGKWNSPQTFGDPETFRSNIKNQGWYVYSMPISQQSQQERESRVAPKVQGACKRAGAIHSGDVLILVEE